MANARLKDRQRQIPNGFTFLVPETGWDSVKVLGRHPSFDRLSAAVLEHFKGNPRLVKKNSWPTTIEGVQEVVESYNTAVCLSNGWHDFVVSNDPATVPKIWPLRHPSGAGVVEAAKRTVAPVILAVEWLGGGLKPVDIQTAEKRAAVCVRCPKNDPDPNFYQRIGAVAAEKVKKLIEMKHELSCKTSVDAKLHTCGPCDCHLPLKVWCPSEHILKHTSEDVKSRLWEQCWIHSEANGKADTSH